MTTRARTPEPETNGTPVAPPDTPTSPTSEERITVLERQVQTMAAALAGLLAQQMQPQVQQAILAQLTGVLPREAQG